MSFGTGTLSGYHTGPSVCEQCQWGIGVRFAEKTGNLSAGDGAGTDLSVVRICERRRCHAADSFGEILCKTGALGDYGAVSDRSF